MRVDTNRGDPMTDALRTAEGIMTMASAVATYCADHSMMSAEDFEHTARRVIAIYESGIRDVEAIIAELNRLDHH